MITSDDKGQAPSQRGTQGKGKTYGVNASVINPKIQMSQDNNTLKFQSHDTMRDYTRDPGNVSFADSPKNQFAVQ